MKKIFKKITKESLLKSDRRAKTTFGIIYAKALKIQIQQEKKDKLYVILLESFHRQPVNAIVADQRDCASQLFKQKLQKLVVVYYF